jgi:hypothetical protein
MLHHYVNSYLPTSGNQFNIKTVRKILSILLNYALSAMGICRSFPRSIVFAPKEIFGLGIPHLYTIQEIFCLKDVVKHCFLMTLTGQLYRLSLECLYLELGSFRPLGLLPFLELSHLASNSLIKSTWEFLYNNQLHLQTDIDLPLPRENDTLLMINVLGYSTNYDTIHSINKFRLFLKALFLSDFTEASGNYLLEEAWQGKQINTHRKETWPAQGNPTLKNWAEWRNYLKHQFLARGRRTKKRLGKWLIEDPDWEWYFDVEHRQLLHKKDMVWTAFALKHPAG